MISAEDLPELRSWQPTRSAPSSPRGRALRSAPSTPSPSSFAYQPAPPASPARFDAVNIVTSAAAASQEKQLAARMRRLTIRMDLLDPRDRLPVETDGEAPRPPFSSRHARISASAGAGAAGELAGIDARLGLLEGRHDALVSGLVTRVASLDSRCTDVEGSRPSEVRQRHQRTIDRLVEHTPRVAGGRTERVPPHRSPPALAASPPPTSSGWRSNRELEARAATLVVQHAELQQTGAAQRRTINQLETTLDDVSEELRGVRDECSGLQEECRELNEAMHALAEEADALRDESRCKLGPLPLSPAAAASASSALERATAEPPAADGAWEGGEDADAALAVAQWDGGWSVERWVESSVDASGLISQALTKRVRAHVAMHGGDEAAQKAAERAFITELAGLDGARTFEALLKEQGGLLEAIAGAVAGAAHELADDENGNSSSGGVSGRGGSSGGGGGGRGGGGSHASWPSPSRANRSAAANSAPQIDFSSFIDAGARVLSYGEVSSFYGGLVRRVGRPHGMSGLCSSRMEHEHCTWAPAASERFTAGNYNIVTTTTIEWTFVTDPINGLARLGLSAWPQPARALKDSSDLRTSATMRLPRALEEFDMPMAEVNAQLYKAGEAPMTRNELVATRLYTGPCFVRYNHVLRAAPAEPAKGRSASATEMLRRVGTHLQRCIPYVDAVGWSHGNGEPPPCSYSATLHCICGAIGKLSKLTRVTKLYRAPGGAMPKAFLEPDLLTDGCGGVEMGFMSTTTDMEQARHYALNAQGARVLYEIHQGVVSRGAEIAWLSQFPAEAEVLFPPFTALDVVYKQRRSADGIDRGEPATRPHGALLIVELAVTVASDLTARMTHEAQREELALKAMGALWARRRAEVRQRRLGVLVGKLRRNVVRRLSNGLVAAALQVWSGRTARARARLAAQRMTAQQRTRLSIQLAWARWVARISVGKHVTTEIHEYMGDAKARLLVDCRVLHQHVARPRALLRMFERPQLMRAWRRWAKSIEQIRASRHGGPTPAALDKWRTQLRERNVAKAAAAQVKEQLSMAHAAEMEALKAAHAAEVGSLRADVRRANIEIGSLTDEIRACETTTPAPRPRLSRQSTSLRPEMNVEDTPKPPSRRPELQRKDSKKQGAGRMVTF